MIATKQFQARLGLIRKYDEQMKEVLSECYAYCLYQWHQGKNKNPHTELVACLVEAKGFLSKLAPKLVLGKRRADMQEEECERRAEATIGFLFMGREAEQAEKKARAAERAAKKAKIDAQNDSVGQDAPEAAKEPSADVVPLAAPGTIEAEAIEVTDALVFHGEVLEVSADEATLLAAYLTQLRMEARKAA